ncbi:pentatricopeptide repeat-containing protein At2g36980, mitochondrial-like, partial [Morus notabilis]|uniref:pentatricopeptide repeat-containing protein At2g36980, mitochondrial-like n=1 Tax=Morus notabilis TaxID=981085 RepID=UPI000CECF377
MQLEVFRITSRIVSLAKSGRISHARKMFDEMSHRDAVAWNAMLASYSHLGLHQEVLSLFGRMRMCDTRPDHFTFTATLSGCAGACELRCGTKIHALILVSGYRSYLPVGNALIDMYGKCLSPSSATGVFEEMNLRNEVTWCSLLFAHTKACQFDIADKVFEVMPIRVEIAWNIMIAGHARCGEIESCLALLKEMLKTSCWPDQWTFSALVNACAESSEVLCGCLLHAFIIK